MIIRLAVLLAAAIALTALAVAQTHAGSQQAGSTLHEKISLETSEIPPDAMDVILGIQPQFVVSEAEREIKHGQNYLDIEGEVEGSEIEFDMLQTPSGWQVVEIQRDLTRDQVPEIVAAALAKDLPDFEPVRIIESIQYGTEAIIYEFIAVDGHGSETLKEVQLENDIATVLTGDPMH